MVIRSMLALLMATGATASAPGALVMPLSGAVHHPTPLPRLARGDVASAFARVLDLPAPAAATDATLPSGDIFARPSAMVVFAIDGLAPASVEELELPALRSIIGGGAAYPLAAASTRPSLRELLTGADVFGASVADSLSVKSGGESLVVCASAGTAAAEACAGGHSHVAAHDEVEKVALEGLAPQQLDMTFDASAPGWASFLKQGGELSLEGSLLTVSLRDALATFDMTSRTDRLLFVEMQLLGSLPRVLQEAPSAADKLADDATDLLLLSSSGLQTLASAHGADSAEYAMGAALLDSTLAHTQGELLGFWNEPMWSLVLQAELDELDASALPAATVHRRPGSRHLLAAAQDISGYTAPKNGTTQRMFAFDTDAQTWQVQAWTFIGMAFAIFYAANFLFYTDYGKDDAGLYSKYKPKDSWDPTRGDPN